MNYPKISIITVNLNNAVSLEETIQSVLNQNYPNLEYIIIDGGSTDGSMDLIKKYESRLAYWESNADEGYGYALKKGLERSTGEIMGWLNSDDLHLPGSLFTIAEIFQSNAPISWITGFPSWSSASGFHLGEMPHTEESVPYWAKRYDLYQKYSRWSRIRYLGGDYLAIQQESTFWRRSLWEKAGATINTSYKLAADTELWCRFFRHENLFTVNCVLAAFRQGGEKQLTQIKRKEYFQESLRALEEARKMLPLAERMSYQLRFQFAKLLKPLYYLNFPFGFLYEKLLQFPPVIHPDGRAPKK